MDIRESGKYRNTLRRIAIHAIPLQLDMKITKVVPVDIATPPEDGSSREALPLYLSPVVAGFPSPAEDYLDRKLDLHEHLVRNSAATFFVRAAGDMGCVKMVAMMVPEYGAALKTDCQRNYTSQYFIDYRIRKRGVSHLPT